ncbi:MAG: hypothetical protein RR571_05710 [Anaerorhabdus sp.]
MRIKKMKNAFGIKDLINETGNDKLSNAIIYSSNGTFKSSFALCFDKLSRGLGNEVKDRLSLDPNDANFQCEIEIGEDIFTENDMINNVIVYSKTIMDKCNWSEDSNVNQMIVSSEYQKELNIITKEITAIKENYISIIENLKLEKLTNEINDVVRFNDKTTYEQLKNNLDILKKTKKIDIPKGFDVSKIGQKSYLAIDDREFSKCATAIIEIVEKELKSNFFDDKLTVDGINRVVEVLENNNFLSEKREVVFTIDGVRISFNNIEDFKKFINDKINEIVGSNPDAIALKIKLEKNLGTTKEASKILEQIKDIEWLNFYSFGRAKILNSMICSRINEDLLNEDIENLGKLESKIKMLKSKIVSQKVDFENALEIHRERFKPPFRIEIANKADSIIDAMIPQFEFYPNSKIDCKKDYNQTRDILSSGERNAFDIINLIVKYETITDKSKAIVILDDLVETFDYSNRIAFIEYIQDMKKNGSNIILLTHNFDFFRTLSSRLGNEFEKYSAYNTNGIVTLCKNDVFFLKNSQIMMIKDLSEGTSEKNLNFREYFLSSLPFVREVFGFIGDSNRFVYLFHYKEDKLSVKIADVVKDIQDKIPSFKIESKAKSLETCEEKYYDFVLSVCDEVVKKDIKPYDLFRKIILSIGCRIKAEKLMINEDYSKITGITSDQTRKLFVNEKHNFSEKGKQLVERVLLSTAEYIHLNAFMYEPLIDIDPTELINLYSDLNSIGDDFYA